MGKLSELDLKGYGRFDDFEKGAFQLETIHAPASWDYIYQNRKLLLRLDQYGLSYAAAYPPSDIVMMMRDRFQRHSAWMTWYTSEQFSAPFNSFGYPNPGTANPKKQADRQHVRYTPAKAEYGVEKEGLRSVTEVFVPDNDPAICQRVTLTNLKDVPLTLKATPVLRHAAMWAKRDPWDKPEWYTKTAYHRDSSMGAAGFSVYITSPVCDTSKRRAAVFWSEGKGLLGAEVSYDKFIGCGSFDNPEAIYDGQLELRSEDAAPWGEYTDHNHLFAYPQVCALQYGFTLEPGESVSFRQVFAWIPTAEGGLLPQAEEAEAYASYTGEARFQAELDKVAAAKERMMSVRSIHTPDEALNQYVNGWLPLQLDWVSSLDRGWPTGMRGGRDAAQDFTAMVPQDPAFTRELILTELSCQRPDGSVPRHFSAAGHSGPERDTRNTVDAGACVIELIYQYLSHTKDWDILGEQLPWLDQPADRTDSLLTHLLKLAEYYLLPEHIGEHGLCKLYEGGWLDTANRLGVKGRGEEVMLTGQVIAALAQAVEIVSFLGDTGRLSRWEADLHAQRYESARNSFIESMRTHAYNSEGYFNGYFKDDGKWLFSARDEDGARRIYGPANYWAVISGAATKEMAESSMRTIEELKCPDGYRLMDPPFVFGSIPNVGRMASGDSPAGRSEHGNPYNHGSHGFLARALAVMGRGDGVREALDCLLPYSQERHPVERAMTPPYGIVNVWEDIPRMKGRGKDIFLTGSTGYGVRIVYEWMLGIKPALAGLVIDPCLPQEFTACSAEFPYAGKRVLLRIEHLSGDGAGVKSLTVNGTPVDTTRLDPASGRRLFAAADSLFDRDVNTVNVIL